jgi:hypothetical protein
MMRLQNLGRLLALCGVAAVLSGCGDDDDSFPSSDSSPSGTAPASLRSRSYDLFEPAGTSMIAFGAGGDTYTFTRPGRPQETGGYVPTKVGSDTWDLILNNSTNGSASRLILTFTASGAGNFAYTPAGGDLITGDFQSAGSGGSTTTGSTTTGSTTTGSSTTGTTTTGTTTTGGPTPTAAPPRLSQIVLNGRAGNPAGAGQTVINFSGSTFTYAGGGFSGSAAYTPSGNTAHLRLTYGGSATGDVDDYTLQFLAPSGSSTPSTFSGTLKVGSAAPGAASGTFTYTQ